MKIYECVRNSDQIEGRGPMVAFAWTEDLDEAIATVKGHGAGGVGDGEVFEIDTESRVDDGTTVPDQRGDRRKVYGPHRNWRGQYVDGRVDGRVDDDTTVPESEREDYALYKSLHARFGGVR